MGSVLKKVMLMLVIFIAAWFLLVAVITAFGWDNNSPTANVVEAGGAIFCSFAVGILSDVNRLQKLKASIPKKQMDVRFAAQAKENLLGSANLLVRQYMEHEKSTFTETAQNRSVNGAKDFQIVLENYPQLTADKGVMDLLEKMQMSEMTLLRQRQLYTEVVADYNGRIHQFPVCLVRKMAGLREIPLDEESIA